MMRFRGILWLLPLALLGWPGWARAVEFKSHALASDEKKIVITFTFSRALGEDELQVVSNYQANYIGLQVPGLSLSKKQLKTDLPPADKALQQFYRFVRCAVSGDQGEVRLYLTKPVNPSDVLVELRDGKAVLEIVKPWWKLPGAAPLDGAPPSAPVFIPDDTAPADPPPAEPLPPDAANAPGTDDGFRDVDAPADSLPAQPPAESTTADPGAAEPPETAPEEADSGPGPDTSRPSAGETYEETAVGELFGPGERNPRPAPDEPARPAREESAPPAGARPGYTEFDLDQIPIAGIEIRGLAFDEALLKLVGSSGFNVVVGKDVEDTEVNLNFTQKEISLKTALDLLCIAYDLVYTIEPDAIVIRGKAPAAP